MFFDSCPICGHAADVEDEGFGFFRSRPRAVNCPTCGKYKPTRALVERLESNEFLPDRHRLSAIVREATARGEVLKLNVNNVKQLMQTARLPQSPTEKIGRILAYMRKQSDHFGAEVELDEDRDYPVAGARNVEEFKRLLAEMVKEGLCEEQNLGDEGYSLTKSGWERAEGIRGLATGGPQAFVAMWFSDEMDETYELGLAPALRECGYNPLCVKHEPHNEKIDEFIEEEIKKSNLVVADFTGQRQSVYYEVGLARGKDIQVIWTCRADEIGDCHFDTRQYNHVVWDSPEDLRAKLVKRIRGSGLARS